MFGTSPPKKPLPSFSSHSHDIPHKASAFPAPAYQPSSTSPSHKVPALHCSKSVYQRIESLEQKSDGIETTIKGVWQMIDRAENNGGTLEGECQILNIVKMIEKMTEILCQKMITVEDVKFTIEGACQITVTGVKIDNFRDQICRKMTTI
jgi:hypothetical protein